VSLKILRLSDNQLSSIPASFGQLSNLNYLNLEGNLFHNASLVDQVRLLWLSNKISDLRRYIPTALFAHPLVQGLDPESLKQLENHFCVYCGAQEVISGVINDTGQEQVFCASCENIIS
jgi:hypothetical protein